MRKTAFLIFFLAVVSFDTAHAVHDEADKTGCLECHFRLPFEGSAITFNEESGEACIRCHNLYHGSAKGFPHPLNVIPLAPVPPDMPVDAKGRVTCITCHTYHSGYKDADGNRGYFLRRAKGKTFCYGCHKNIFE
ncbi:MAG: cytochrome c3 family protein [Nitrospirae bacterium]|nr:cytochrome c3 family protein [Nitrospirota bacterium]